MPSKTYWLGAKFRDRYVKPEEGVTLIIGSLLNGEREDRRGAFSKAIGIDMQAGPGVDVVHDLEDPLPREFWGEVAHVECVSVMEHCRRPWKVAETLTLALRPGGTIFLSVPFVWRWHGYPSDYFRYTADGVRSLFPLINWEVMRYASTRLKKHHYLNALGGSGDTMLPRCEVLGFGRRL